MTDNDTIKALKYCSKGGCNKKCPLCDIEHISHCTETLLANALSLIKRQQAEIEKLQKHLEELADSVEDKMMYMCGCRNCIETVTQIIKDDRKPFDMLCKSCGICKPHVVTIGTADIFTKDYEEYEKLIATIATDVLTEFVELLKEKVYPLPCAIGVEHAVTVRAIDETMKEAIGEV